MKFELSRLTDYSDESLIQELIRVSKITNEILTKSEFKKYAKVSESTICKRFGSWENALSSAGLKHRYCGKVISEKQKSQSARFYSESELIIELQRIAKLLNKDELSTQDFNENSEISSSAIRNRFGNWKNGLMKAGLKEVKNAMRYTETDYFENILNVWTHYGRQPKCREMNIAPSIITQRGYEHKWGKFSNALISFIEFINNGEPLIKEINDNQSVLLSLKEISKTAEDKRDIPLGLRYRVLSRDRFKCVKCGKSPASDIKCKLHIDHIIPFSKGGKTLIDNLQTSCEECNIGKGNRYEE